jgi:hypothetical protein
MKIPPTLACLLALAALLLGGCELPPDREPHHPRVYLMMVVPEGMAPAALPARREQIIAYLLESGLLDRREDLVSDATSADRIIRAVLLEDGFKLSFFNPDTGRSTAYEPTYMPDDYYYYEGLIFYGTAGSAYRRHRDDDGRNRPAPKPSDRDRDRDRDRDHGQPAPVPPGDRPHQPDHRDQPGRPDQPDNRDGGDHRRPAPRPDTPDQPRTTPPTDRPHPLPNPGPGNNRPRYDDHPRQDARPTPRDIPHDDDRRKKDDDKPRADPPRPVTVDPKPDNAIVPAK